MANPQDDMHQLSSTDSGVADSSESLFKMYSQMAENEHKETAKRWQKDADGILIFTGLFSAAVAVLVAVTIPDLKQPNSQDTSAYYLRNIYYLLLADTNGSHPSILDVSVDPPPQHPLNYVIWVNSLWLLSLGISLTSAMLATILQQCARRYLRITQRPQYSPHDEARMRAFFARGVDLMRFSWMVEAIPFLIHISLFLFFSGLLVYLFNINHHVFYAVVGWIALSATLYLVITLIPTFWLNSPYHASLSPVALWACTAIPHGIFFVLSRLSPCLWHRAQDLAKRPRSLEKMAEVRVRDIKLTPDIDGFILKWTFDAHSLASDHQLIEFLENLLKFARSDRIVHDPQSSFATLRSKEFGSAMVTFLNRTLSSDSVGDSVKIERFLLCVKVADATHATALGDLPNTVRDVVQTIEVGRKLRPRDNNDKGIGLCAQTIVAGIIAKVPGQEGNDDWIGLAVDQLGKSQDEVQQYLEHGNNSVLLANLIHIARQILDSSSGITQHMAGDAASYILRLGHGLPDEFDIQSTLPELQHKFCALWNEINEEANRSGDSSVPHFILYQLRKHFNDLHQGTVTDDAPTYNIQDFTTSSYPFCNNPQHLPPAQTMPAPQLTITIDPALDIPPNLLSLNE